MIMNITSVNNNNYYPDLSLLYLAAVASENLEAVKVLLDAGASPNPRNFGNFI